MDKEIMDNAWNESILFFQSNLSNKESIPMTSDYIYGYSNSERLSNSDDIDLDVDSKDLANGKGNSSSNRIKSTVDAKETFNVMIGSSKHPQIADNVLWV